jgi:hypothetical protein
VVTTRTLGVELTATGTDPAAKLRLFAYVAPLPGTPIAVVDLGELVAGRHLYTSPVACPDGCRLVGFEVAKPTGGGFDARLVLHAMYQNDPPAPVPGADFVQSGHWRPPVPEEGGAVPVLTPGPDGLAVDIKDPGSGYDASILPVDAALPLPVVSAGRPLPGRLGGLDGTVVPTAHAGTVAVLPHLGTAGGLVDMEYAERDSRESGSAIDAQVWLTADAPPGLPDRLRAAGLTIVDSQSDVDRAGYLSHQGPGAGLRFHLLAGLLALALAIGALLVVAAVDRRYRGQLRVLRVQGVPRRALAASVRRGYLGVVLVALLLGPLAAGAAWLATGDHIPVFADSARIVPPPAWPRWSQPLLAWAICAAVLSAGAVFAAAVHGTGRSRDSVPFGGGLTSSGRGGIP